MINKFLSKYRITPSNEWGELSYSLHTRKGLSGIMEDLDDDVKFFVCMGVMASVGVLLFIIIPVVVWESRTWEIISRHPTHKEAYTKLLELKERDTLLAPSSSRYYR